MTRSGRGNGVSDDERRILQDPDFRSSILTAKELKKKLQEWGPKRELTLLTLEDIKKNLEESYQKRTIAKVSGASAAIVGGTMAIVGFGLSFVTFGASLGLTIAGGILAASGGATMGGADIGEWIISKTYMKVVKTTVEKDRSLSTEIKECAEKLTSQVRDLNIRYPSLKEEKILGAIANIAKGSQVGKFLYDGYKIIDTGFDIGRGLLRAGRFGGAGVGASRIAWTGLNTVAGRLSVAGVVFDAIALPFDVFVLIKGAYDINKYKNGHGSNSNRANKVEEMIKGLNKHQVKMLEIQSIFEDEQ